MHRHFNQTVKINGDILQYIVNNPKKARIPLILFEDTHSLKVSKIERIISKKGRFRISESRIYHPMDNESGLHKCKSLDSLAFVLAIDEIDFSNSEYEVKGLNHWLDKGIHGNVSIENVRALDSIYIDSDGLDFKHLTGKNVRFGPQGIHTSSLPFKRLFQFVKKFAGEYKRIGKHLQICIISPNFEAIKYNGFHSDLSNEQIEEIEGNIGYICLRIGDSESMAEERLFKNPRKVISECLSDEYLTYVRELSMKLQSRLYVDISENLKKFVGKHNPSTQLIAYVKKRTITKVYTPSEIKNSFIEQSKQLEKVCNKKSHGELIGYLFDDDLNSNMILSLSVSRAPGESVHTKSFNLKEGRKSKLSKGEVIPILEKILTISE